MPCPRARSLLLVALAVTTGCFEDTGGVDPTTAGSTGHGASSSDGTTVDPMGSTGADASATTDPDGTTSIEGTTDESTTDGTTSADDGATTTSGDLPACADNPVVAMLPGRPNTSCGGQWDVDGIPMQIQNSLHPTCGTGGCSAGSDANGVWVYPAQLFADLSEIGCEPSVVEVTLTSHSGAGALVTLFDGVTGDVMVEATSQLNNNLEVVSVAVPLGAELGGVGIHGCEDQIHEILVR